MYRQVRDGVQGIFVARPYSKRVWYAKRLSDGRQRTLLIVRADRNKEDPGLPFIVHVSRFKKHLGVSEEQLRAWLPENTGPEDVKGWSGSDPEEREKAEGLSGYFQNEEVVYKFLAGLRSREQAQE